jgi:predicted TIM-barrel fold metal-dependent hydrolase
MDAYGIQTQVVSISEPGVYYLPTAAERQAMAQQINDYTATELVHTSNPLLRNRFGGFGVLPLGDVGDPTDIANAQTEATRVLDELKLDGVGLYSTFLYEFVFDTTRAVVNLLYHGVFDRYPDIRWLIAHAGGTIPFIAYRTSLLTLYPAIAQNLGISGIDDQNADYAELFYDTALSPAPSAMQSVRQVTSVSHIMFATDWPFSAPLFILPGDPAPQLAQTFSSTELAQVDRGNALAQLPNLAARLDGELGKPGSLYATGKSKYVSG